MKCSDKPLLKWPSWISLAHAWFYLKQSKSSQPLRVSPRVYFWRPRALRSSCTVSGAPCRTETCIEIQKTQDGFPSQCEGHRRQRKERTNEMRIRRISIMCTLVLAGDGTINNIPCHGCNKAYHFASWWRGAVVFSVQLVSLLSALMFPLLSLLFHKSKPPQENVKTFC